MHLRTEMLKNIVYLKNHEFVDINRPSTTGLVDWTGGLDWQTDTKEIISMASNKMMHDALC